MSLRYGQIYCFDLSLALVAVYSVSDGFKVFHLNPGRAGRSQTLPPAAEDHRRPSPGVALH